jgi:23S rRNA (uridine2552-2'-O)-methyltransferase
MGKKDKRWVLQRKKDFYYKLAKKNKYRSRASYKLLQLNEKFNIIKENNVVVDLGCAPGGWLQAARDIVGEDGFVAGVDLQAVKPLEYENVVAIKGDMTKKETIEKLMELIPSKADAVICDASPNISGVWEVDHTRSIELTTIALMTATKLLKKDGNFVVKVFQGSLFNDYVALLKNYFKKVQTTKPKASRDVSAEVYVVGKRFLDKPFDRNLKSPILKLIDFKAIDGEEKDEEKIKIIEGVQEDKGLMIKKIKELRKERNK